LNPQSVADTLTNDVNPVIRPRQLMEDVIEKLSYLRLFDIRRNNEIVTQHPASISDAMVHPGGFFTINVQ
jgi:hypothetical protein